MFSIQPEDNLDDMANSPQRDAEKDGTRQELPQGQSSTESKSEEQKRTIRGFLWVIVCISLYVTCFLYGLDTAIAADVQGPVIEAFGQVDQLAWIGAGFPLGSVCVILLLGKLYNPFNIKWVFIATVVLFEAGSALCGGTPNSKPFLGFSMDHITMNEARKLRNHVSFPFSTFYLRLYLTTSQ